MPIDNVAITQHLDSILEARDEGSAAREEDASPVGDHHLRLIGNGIGNGVAAHVPRHTGRRFGLDARNVHTQIADSIRHGDRLAAIEFLSSRIHCDTEFRIDVTAIHVKVLFRSQQLLVEAIVGVHDRCGVVLAFPCSLVLDFVFAAIFYSLQSQLVKSICVLDRHVVDELVVREVTVVVRLSDLAGAGHVEPDAARDIFVRNLLVTLSVQIVQPLAAEHIAGILTAIVQFQDIGVKFVGYGDAVAFNTCKRDLVPVDRQFNPTDRTRSYRFAVFFDFKGSDICILVIADPAIILQPDGIQVFDHAIILLGFVKPCRIDFGLVGYLDLPCFARSSQARLPVVGEGDDHGIFTIVRSIVVYGIGLARQKTTDFQGARDDAFNKGFSVYGSGCRIYVIHDRPGQTAFRDIDDGFPRDLHAVLMDIHHGFVDVSDAVVGNDFALAPVRLVAIGHNDVAKLSPQRKVLRLDICRIGDLIFIGMARI